MDADFSIELGRDDPVLELPWSDPSGKVAYADLKRHPELISELDEAKQFPALADFLRAVNSHSTILESAKCDVWSSDDLSVEEDIFNARCKFASYVDLVLCPVERRESFAFHQRFLNKLVELLRRAPQTRSSAELLLRRCYFGKEPDAREGYYFTFYISGYGEEERDARQNWEIALKLAGNAILQLSAAGLE